MNFAEFLRSIPLLLQLYAEMYRETDFKNTMLDLESEYNVPKTENYDFIVVGGGSAGCVLAGRLSEQFNVLLLEAGGSPPPSVTVPFLVDPVEVAPTINYFFSSVPQTNVPSCCRMTCGKMLGGSGSHNSMFHIRGHPKDFDNWAVLLNDESFNYSNVLKYFRKMETFVGTKFGTEGDEYYGNDGPIMVNSFVFPMLDLWLQAGRELGYYVGDPNGFQREGFAPLNVAVRNGKRSSSYAEYIEPYEGSRNTLKVIRYANVSEILLDDYKKAYGVAFSRHGFPRIAHARKEIILSAGTFSSPLLLMKSGIGPESVLNAAEIPVKVPLEAVGKNLVDHVAMGIRPFSHNDSSLFQKNNSPNTEQIFEQYHNGSGILAFPRTGALAFKTHSNAEPGWPNIFIRMYFSERVDDEEPRMSFTSIVGRPQSKGFLSMDTDKYKEGIRDDVQLALIDFNLLTHPDDVETMLEGVKTIFKLLDTEAFKSINLTYAAVPDPECGAFTFLTDDYWRCRIRRVSGAWGHIVGTCSLGPSSGSPATSVVDTKFRVRGVSNLRVVDASVIPEITNTHINAAVLMLAEKAAEDILNFYAIPETTVSVSTTNTEPTISSTSLLPDSSGTRSTFTYTKTLFVVFTLIYFTYAYND